MSAFLRIIRPRWVWSRAGFQTDRRPSAADILSSVHPDVRRLVDKLPGANNRPSPRSEYWPGWYPEVGAYVERVGEDEWVIAFYDDGKNIHWDAAKLCGAPIHSTAL